MRNFLMMILLCFVCASWQAGPAALSDAKIIIRDTVHIGKMVWMKKNLNIPGPNSFWYDRDSVTNAKNGRLYFFSGAQAVCPKGWHIPTDQEWTEMMEIIGGDSTTAYVKLLPGGESHLDLPLAGYRSSTSKDDMFGRKGESGFYWTGTVKNEGFAYARQMNGTERKITSTWYRRANAFSVRYVMDREVK